MCFQLKPPGCSSSKAWNAPQQERKCPLPREAHFCFYARNLNLIEGLQARDRSRPPLPGKGSSTHSPMQMPERQTVNTCRE